MKKNITVIKIGTKILVSDVGKMKLGIMQSLADQVALLYEQGYAPVIISSGAVACGNNGSIAKNLTQQQVAASVGQPILMRHWENAFSQHGLIVGQIIGVRTQFKQKEMIGTIHALIDRGIIPIINENDPAATEELIALREHGDNDMLSAIVSRCINAERLIILTDVEGLCNGGSPKDNDQHQLIPVVSKVTRETLVLARRSELDQSSGMHCKIEAMQLITESHIPGQIANGNRPNILIDLLGKNPPGTLFQAQ